LISAASFTQMGDDWFGEDKGKHTAVCFFIVLVVWFLCVCVSRRQKKSNGEIKFRIILWISCWMATLVGIGKEVLDLYTGGTASFKDIVADMIGVGLGAGVARCCERSMREYTEVELTVDRESKSSSADDNL